VDQEEIIGVVVVELEDIGRITLQILVVVVEVNQMEVLVVQVLTV
jgi:hypothetical protein